MPMNLPAREARALEARPACARKHVACVELVTTAALALSTAVAITAVSIGIARADVLGAVANGDSAPFAIALFIGLLLSAMGGLPPIMPVDPQQGVAAEFHPRFQASRSGEVTAAHHPVRGSDVFSEHFPEK